MSDDRVLITYEGSGVAVLEDIGVFAHGVSAFVEPDAAERAREHGSFKIMGGDDLAAPTKGPEPEKGSSPPGMKGAPDTSRTLQKSPGKAVTSLGSASASGPGKGAGASKPGSSATSATSATSAKGSKSAGGLKKS